MVRNCLHLSRVIVEEPDLSMRELIKLRDVIHELVQIGEEDRWSLLSGRRN